MFYSLLHKSTACFLAAIMLAGTINNAVIMGEFLVNQDLIATTLCVQKEAQVDCFGKCQLREALNGTSSEVNTNDPKTTNERTIALEIIVYLEAISPIKIRNSAIAKSPLIIDGIEAKIPSMYYDIDTPPPLLV